MSVLQIIAQKLHFVKINLNSKFTILSDNVTKLIVQSDYQSL